MGQTQATLSPSGPGQPFAVGFLTDPEPINAPPGTERGLPEIVPDKAKSSIADRTTLGGALTKMLRMTVHFSSSPP